MVAYEISGRMQAAFDDLSNESKDTYVDKSKSQSNKCHVANRQLGLRVLLWCLIFQAVCSSAHAAEPFDGKEFDLIMAYMLLPHGARPWFPYPYIDGLHQPPIHLHLSIQYIGMEDVRQGTRTEILQQTNQDVDYPTTVQIQPLQLPIPDISGSTANRIYTAHPDDNFNRSEIHESNKLIELSDSLCLRGNDSANDEDFEAIAHERRMDSLEQNDYANDNLTNISGGADRNEVRVESRGTNVSNALCDQRRVLSQSNRGDVSLRNREHDHRRVTDRDGPRQPRPLDTVKDDDSVQNKAKDPPDRNNPARDGTQHALPPDKVTDGDSSIEDGPDVSLGLRNSLYGRQRTHGSLGREIPFTEGPTLENDSEVDEKLLDTEDIPLEYEDHEERLSSSDN